MYYTFWIFKASKTSRK